MEVRVKMTRPLSASLHHVASDDEYSLVYILSKEATLEYLMHLLWQDCEGLSINNKVLFKGTVLNSSLRRSYKINHPDDVFLDFKNLASRTRTP